jgi:hypothetical protein
MYGCKGELIMTRHEYTAEQDSDGVITKIIFTVVFDTDEEAKRINMDIVGNIHHVVIDDKPAIVSVINLKPNKTTGAMNENGIRDAKFNLGRKNYVYVKGYKSPSEEQVLEVLRGWKGDPRKGIILKKFWHEVPIRSI